MKYEPMIKAIQLKVEEVSEKYQTLKEELPALENLEANDPLQQTLKELELLDKEIQEHYAQLIQEENRNEKKLSEIEKIIYTSIRSFNLASTSAGSILKSK